MTPTTPNDGAARAASHSTAENDAVTAADGTSQGAGQAAASRVTATPRAGILPAVAPRFAAVLLGAACIAWTATPLLSSGLAQTALVFSIIGVTAGALRLAFADIPLPEDDYLLPPGYVQAGLVFLGLLRTLAWEETAVVAILWLEVQHPSRPWHTFGLGAGLVAYLIVTHIAESGADPVPVLRRQWKLLAVGACLLALGAGFAEIPPATTGAGSALLRVLAAIAVVAATVLVLPA